MASVGESAARGLESGFRLGMQMQEQQRQVRRQDMLDQRQMGLDQRAQEDRARGLQRQGLSDRMAVHGQRKEMMAAEAQGLASGNPDAATRQDFTQRSQALDRAHHGLLGEMDPAYQAEREAYDVDVVRKKADASAAALMNGDIDVFGKDPNAFRQLVTQKTGHAPAEYLRGPNGEPSRIEQAIQAMMGGLEGGDPDLMLEGANVIFGTELNKGVGSKGAHGGTIVGKRFVSMIPDPQNPKERVIPTVRVYVDGGKPLTGPMPADAPPGATGYYDAPLTENRSSDPNDKVKSISIKDQLDKVGKHGELAELVNSPEGAQLMELDRQATWDPERFKQELARRGGKKVEPKVESYTMKPGEQRFEKVTVGGVSTTTKVAEGSPKKERSATLIELAQQRADAKGTTVETEYAKLRRAGLSSGSGGGGGGGDEDGLTAAQKRKRDADRDVLKGTIERADKNADNAENALKTAQQALHTLETKVGGMMYEKDPADPVKRAELEREIKEKNELAKKARARASSLSAELDKLSQPAAEANDGLNSKPPAKPPANAPAGKLSKDAAAAKFGF